MAGAAALASGGSVASLGGAFNMVLLDNETQAGIGPNAKVSAVAMHPKALVVGIGYPWIVTTFQVKPNQNQLQAQYYERNLKATKAAYGIDVINLSLGLALAMPLLGAALFQGLAAFVLIGLGLLFLLSNLGVVRTAGWDLAAARCMARTRLVQG